MRTVDIMTRPVHTVRENDPVAEINALLADQMVTVAAVLNDDGELVGMVGHEDLLRYHASRPDQAGGPATAAQVMTRTAAAVSCDAEVAQVAAMMLDQSVHSVPVVADGHLLGIVSRHDVLRTLVGGDDLACREIRRRLDAYADGEQRWHVSVHHGTALIGGEFDDDVERTVVSVLARTVNGVHDVVISQPVGEVDACG